MLVIWVILYFLLGMNQRVLLFHGDCALPAGEDINVVCFALLEDIGKLCRALACSLGPPSPLPFRWARGRRGGGWHVPNPQCSDLDGLWSVLSERGADRGRESANRWTWERSFRSRTVKLDPKSYPSPCRTASNCRLVRNLKI